MSNGASESKGFWSIFFVFSGYVLSVTAFVLGGNAGSQLGFTKGVLALLIGNMLLACYAGTLGYIGKQSSCSSTDLFKPVYGIKGQVLTASVVSLFSLVFVSVYSALVGSMAASLFPGLSPFVGLVVYLVILLYINLKGFKGLSAFSKIGVPMIAAFVLYGLFVVEQKVGFSNVISAEPTAPVPFFDAVSIIAASWMTGATFSSDITRFVKQKNHVFLVPIGAFICVTFLEAVALACALGTGQSDLIVILSDLGMSAVAFILYILLTITSGQAVVFIAAQALENITKVVRGQVGKESDGKFTATHFIMPSCVFAGAIGVFMIVNGFTSSFLGMLGIIGTAIPPVGGTLVGHFLVVEREFVKTFENMPSYRPAGFVAWIIGIACSTYITFGIKPLNGFIAAAIVYIVLRKMEGNKSATATN